MSMRSWIAFSCLMAMVLIAMPLKSARADLTITPIRVVFQDRDRSATVTLVNVTNRTNTYRFSWMKMQMNSTGRYLIVPDKEDPDPNSVANMVIFTPRQVTILPHGQQTIRLGLRRPADLPPGEYRAHLAITRLADMGPVKQDPNAKSVSMELKVNLSFTIPVIVRSGEDKDLKVQIVNPHLGLGEDKKTPELFVDITRVAGKFSSYGFFEVYWTPPGGSEKKIGELNNIALYPELPTRHIDIPLDDNPDKGSLRVIYKGKYESDNLIWDEKTFPIGS